MSGSSFTNIFGGNAVKPAQPSFLALSFGANATLVWPLESTEGTNALAAQINATATATGLDLILPPGDMGSVGVQSVINNVGANAFTVTDWSGNAVATIAASQSWVISLIDNSPVNGTWSALQLGATTSNAQAASLAGPGLAASGTELETVWSTAIWTAPALITAALRSTEIVWQGASATLQLDTIANLTAGWFAAVANQGTGELTLTGSGGQTINGVGQLVIQPGNSAIIVCGAAGFNTIGTLPFPLPVANGGTGATTAEAALDNLGGSAIGQSIFTAASASAVVSLLGLNASVLNESSIATNQTLAATSASTAFVCTAALTLTLPLTTTISKSFVIAVLAQGGAVTLAPQVTDTISGSAAGASVVLAQGSSILLLTDAAGHWYMLFAALPMTGGAINGGISVTGEIVGSALTPGGQFRAVGGQYGVILRNDGAEAYLLQTAFGSPNGAWNAYRPFGWTLSTGAVAIDGTGAGVSMGGTLTLPTLSATTVDAGTVNGTTFVGNWQTYEGAHLIHFGWNGHVNLAIDNAYQYDLIGNNGGTYDISISGNAATATSATSAGSAATATSATNATNATYAASAGSCSGNAATASIATAVSAQGNSLGFAWDGSHLQFSINNTPIGTINYTLSDYRLKHSVETLASGLDLIRALEPVSYRIRKSDVMEDDGPKLGFMADKTEPIIPSAVNGEKDAVDDAGRIVPQSMNPMPIVAALSRAVQELHERLDALERLHGSPVSS